jgi:hypothetical protein
MEDKLRIDITWNFKNKGEFPLAAFLDKFKDHNPFISFKNHTEEIYTIVITVDKDEDNNTDVTDAFYMGAIIESLKVKQNNDFKTELEMAQ